MKLLFKKLKTAIQSFGQPTFFEFQGKKLPYFHHPYNHTAKNERALEVSLIKYYYDQYAPDQILEVGNVLKHYFPLKHQVVDKYEKHPEVINEDILTFKPQKNKKYSLILAISTLEHVGWDEYPRDPQKIPAVLTHLYSLLKKNGQIVFSVPLGYNHDLDNALRSRQIGLTQQFYFKKINRNNTWEQRNSSILQGAKYNWPFENANELMIGIITKTTSLNLTPELPGKTSL